MTISESSIFILNPYFRLRNLGTATLLYGSQIRGIWHLHPAFGIVLSLCNGKRSIGDISKIVSPFVGVFDEQDAYKIALSKVMCFVNWMSFSKLEQDSRSVIDPQFPENSPLVIKDVFNHVFSCFCPHIVEYDPYTFLPSNGRMPPLETLHESSPFNINWHLTSDCSTNCKYCYLGRREVSPMPVERVLSLINEASDIGVVSIDLNGGDVLLSPHLCDVISSLSEHKFLPVDISTKSFLSKEKAMNLGRYAKNMLNELQFSIDTDDDEVAQYLVGVPNFCERIFQSIDNALDVGLRVVTKIVVTPYNVLNVPRLYRKLKKRGVSTIRLAAYARSGYHHSDDLFLNEVCYQWLDSEAKKLSDEFSEEVNIQNGGPQYESVSKDERKQRWVSRVSCTAGRSGMVICADGKVIPCEQMPETDEYFCGDLTNQSIMEVWNGKPLKEMTYGMPREKFKNQPCYDCEEREECHNIMGYCIRDLAAHYGNIYQPPPNCYRHDIPFVRQT